MKLQALFSLKDKSKKIRCLLLQFLFGALRVNIYSYTCIYDILATNNKSSQCFIAHKRYVFNVLLKKI